MPTWRNVHRHRDRRAGRRGQTGARSGIRESAGKTRPGARTRVQVARRDCGGHLSSCVVTLPKTGFFQANTTYGDMTVNSYLVWDPETKLAAAFDTGADATPLLDETQEAQSHASGRLPDPHACGPYRRVGPVVRKGGRFHRRACQRSGSAGRHGHISAGRDVFARAVAHRDARHVGPFLRAERLS